ncbi:MAG: sensor histidine kinase [Mobilitalea sp.]
MVYFLYDYYKSRLVYLQLQEIKELSDVAMDLLPPAKSIDDQNYQRIIHLLWEEKKQAEDNMNLRYFDMIEYYTVWAHQIKTPIASIRLWLQNEDSSLSRKISLDLTRIEQYVDMVLMFLRLGSDTTDYIFREYDLDQIVKEAVKKFAGEFINRKIQLIYEPLNTVVITDEKWLSFVVEQLLSNALKYTQTGSVTVFMKGPKLLCIQDTGIGISPEDVPRVFDKGYTGFNGRYDKKASGIGLYLCKRVCTNLGHRIHIDSVLDEGTLIQIDLSQNKFEYE